jgi:hypothetical protein
MSFCGLDVENLFSLYFWVDFFVFHLLIILVVVEFLDDFSGVSLLCAFVCIVGSVVV